MMAVVVGVAGKARGTTQIDRKDNNTMEIPISKISHLESMIKLLIETEKTPAINEPCRQFTRSAIISDRKEPSQSAIKEQSTRKTPGRSRGAGRWWWWRRCHIHI